jgi:methylenetetrahydrofolate dehydrogenase (NADP+)/methenyltetrahydrofolate cyclohydrolase
MWITMGKIIDGKKVAAKIREGIKVDVARLRDETGIIPKLSVVLVGENPASISYVRGKEKACAEAGIESTVHRLPSTIKEEDVIDLVASINSDPSVHGILVQLPLPKGMNETRVLRQILPTKDVDGLHPENMGKLFKGEDPLFIPCTPLGVMELILSTGIDLKGKRAVIVGRSNLVGKPLAILLLGRHATVTWCHSKTEDLGGETARADILIGATGKPGLITADMVKPGAIVIDVGTTRTEKGLTGDVDFEAVKGVASYITPVPGGVGPMTITMLLKSVLASAKRVGGPSPKSPPDIQAVIA